MVTNRQELVKFGPWPRGLNNRDQTFASDLMTRDELRFLKNWDVSDSGVLVPRLGVRKVGSAAMYTDVVVGAGGHFVAMGSNAATGSPFLYAVVGVYRGNAANNFNLYYNKWPDNAGAWTLVPKGLIVGDYCAIVTYNATSYIVPKAGSVGSVGKSTVSIASGVAWTAIATMPFGDLSFILKDRMFIVNKGNSRIYYSKVTDPTNWTPPDGGFFDVSPGDQDGGITDVAVVNNLIYIFKLNSYYVFSYDIDPGLDGRLTPLSKDLGAYSAVVYRGSIYVVNRSSVFKIINNQATDIARQLDLPTYAGLDIAEQVGNTWINVEGNRIIIGPFTVSSYTHFAMNLMTGAWSGRFYDDQYTAPRGKAISAVDNIAFGNGGVSQVYCPQKNDGTKDYVSYTRLRATFGDVTSTMDVDRNDHTISPEYSLATSDYVGRDYNEFKHMRQVNTRYNWPSIATGDNVMSLSVCDSNLSVLETKNTPQSNPLGDKLDFTSRSYQGVTFKAAKLTKDLVALDPNTNSYLVMREINLYNDTNNREISQ